ncbi:MAG: hypothetical protein IJQ04_01415 [Prevotella sp.]|nr:hypothetical protein [Prevotella sp.]
MKFWKYTLPLIVLMMIGTLKATAAPVVTPKAYMFGFVANFTDSVVYFTDIQTVDSVWYDKKTKFLLGRSGYSNQLREYFTDKMNKPHSTCIVIFSLTRKDAEKKFVKLRKKYVGKNAGAYEIRNLNENEFHFKSIDMSPNEDDQAVSKKSKNKKEKKPKKVKK